MLKFHLFLQYLEHWGCPGDHPGSLWGPLWTPLEGSGEVYGGTLGSQGGPWGPLERPWGSYMSKSGCGSCQDEILGGGEYFQ